MGSNHRMVASGLARGAHDRHRTHRNWRCEPLQSPLASLHGVGWLQTLDTCWPPCRPRAGRFVNLKMLAMGGSSSADIRVPNLPIISLRSVRKCASARGCQQQRGLQDECEVPKPFPEREVFEGGKPRAFKKQHQIVIHARCNHSNCSSSRGRVRSSPSTNAPILGVIGLIAGAVLPISETSSYLWTVLPMHNLAAGALFGRAFLTPVRPTPHCAMHICSNFPSSNLPVISAYQFLMLHKTMQ